MSSKIQEAKKWAIFSLIDSNLLAKIKFAIVFGTSGNEAIFITTNDDIYALGTNCSGCLGLGDAQNYLHPKKIEMICQKQVVSISCGSGPHILAVTADGNLYAWGHNGYCQLGNGCNSQLLSPAPCTTNLKDRQVIELACGGHHSMVLTKDGEVFAWGQNNCGQVGSGSVANQPTPWKICAGVGNKTVITIACSQSSSYAVTSNGEVYGWGYNGSGQMGIGNNQNQSCPVRVDQLRDVFVQSIRCGFGHTMVVTDDGSLYAWGANSYGQVGVGTKTNAMVPVKVAPELGKFVEVGAIHYSNISSAITEKGCVYAWGLCRGQSVLSPMETNFEDINDVFALLSTPAITCKPIKITTDTSQSVAESISSAFDDSSTSDIIFVVDEKLIHVHKAIIKIRCKHFDSMFQDQWQENQKSKIQISDYSYPVYRAFLEFLYTDKVNLEPGEMLGLLDLANAYCEDSLRTKCEQLIRNSITSENVLDLYAAAIRYQSTQLEECCFRYAINHLTMVSQSEALDDLDDCVLKNFIKKAGKAGAFKF